jgi:hypothetical protein
MQLTDEIIGGVQEGMIDVKIIVGELHRASIQRGFLETKK